MGASKIISTSFDITIVDGRSSQTKIIKSNMRLTDLYLEVPVLATAKKTAKLTITTERGNMIFAINELDASSAKTYSIRLSKSLMGAITLEITTDATVTGNKTFTIELRGYGWVVSDSAEQDGYYYAKLGSTNLYGLERPSFRITEELNKIPSFEFEIANCSENRTAIAAGITDVFRIYRRIYSVDTLMFTGIINGDAIEYLSLERIRITGYASYIDLNWRFHQHLNSEDAENADKVYNYTGTYSDKTTEANNDTINDVSITWSSVNDALYIGQGEQFFGMQIKYSTKGVQAAIDAKYLTNWSKSGSNPLQTKTCQNWMIAVYSNYNNEDKIYIFEQRDAHPSNTISCSSFTRANAAIPAQWTDHGVVFTAIGAHEDGHIEPHGIIFETQAMADAREGVGAGLGTRKWRMYYCAKGVGEATNKYSASFAYAAESDLTTWTAYANNPVYDHDATWGFADSKVCIYDNKVWMHHCKYKVGSSCNPSFFSYSDYGLGSWTDTTKNWTTERTVLGTLISYSTGILLTGNPATPDRYTAHFTTDGDDKSNYSDNPILSLGASGQWDDADLHWCTIVVDKDGNANLNSAGTYYMYYIGYDGATNKLGLATSTTETEESGTTVIVEYSKGSSAWSTLDVLDETRAFTEDVGTYYITIPHKPSDWAKDTVNSVKKFWIRARLSAGSYTTQPKLDRIKMTNTDVYRVYYFDTAADTIMDEVLAGTGYSTDVTDVCPSDTISIVAEYETKLRIVAGIANALTWDDSGDKKGYQWWIDTSKKVHLKQKRGAILGDITGELTILNNIEDYFNLSNRLHFFGNYDGLNQLRAVIENIDSQDTHEIRELAVPEERHNNYIPLKEAAQKAMTYTKAPLQKIAATVTTKYWLDNSFEVGDTVTLHATSWDVASQAFQIVRADIGARVTNLDMGISQEHLDALKAGLQRQLDISGIRMHGSTTLLQFGPETMNYQRVDGSTVYPAHLKFEIPSDARYIHKVLVSWKLGPYRAEVTGGTESEGHDHTGTAGAGGDFTPAVEDGGEHTPTELSKAHSHNVDVDLNMVLTSATGYLPTAKAVSTESSHTHPKGSTDGPDDTGDAIVGVVFGDECSSVGHCVDYVSWDTFAEDSHWHRNTGLSTGVGTSHGHNITTHAGSRQYLTDIQLGIVGSANEDPAHAHTINLVTAHPHTGVYHGKHSDHVITTESASNVNLELGIIEVPGGTVMQLTVNGEDVTTVNGNGTDIVITGYCSTGSNTVELYPIVGSNTKGGATLEGRGILFIEAAKF